MTETKSTLVTLYLKVDVVM